MKLLIMFPYMHSDRDRHGNVRLYYRRRVGERKVRLRSEPGTAEFAAEYEAAKSMTTDAVIESSQTSGPLKDTFGWLVATYLRSADFGRLQPSTRRTRQRLLEACLIESIAPGARNTFGEFPLNRLTAKALRVLRDRKEDLPGAANDRVKALRAMLAWAANRDLVDSNPATDVKRLRYSSTGHHTWTVEDVEQFEVRHPVGSKARLALALLLWTGVRRSDVVRLGKQHVKDGWLKIALFKNNHRSPVTVELPMSTELNTILDASATGDLAFLVTEYGKPFSAAGFGQWFRQRCDEAGLSHCSAHGLRKAGAVRAAENGATAHELMAVFGWLSLAEAQRYTRAADRRVLAKNATRLLARTERKGRNE